MIGNRFHESYWRMKKTKWALFWLSLILFIRWVSFFTIGGDGAYSANLKLVLRLVVDVLMVLVSVGIKNPLCKIQFSSQMPVYLYMVFLIQGAISLTYTSSFAVSSMQLMMYVESFLFSYLFVRKVLTYEIIDVHFFYKIIFTSIGLIGVIFFAGTFIAPDLFFRFTYTDNANRLGGYLMNPNQMGLILVVLVLVSISLIDLRKVIKHFLYYAAILMGLYCVYLTGSRSAAIAFLVSFLCLLYLKGWGYKKILYVSCFVTILVLIPVYLQDLYSKGISIMTRGDQVDDVLTLTGRLPFWADLIQDAIPKEFMFGYGFQRIFYTDFYFSKHSYAAEMAHNSYLQLFLSLGFIGFITGVALIVYCVYATIRRPNDPKKKLALILSLPACINSLTEFGIFGLYNFGVLLFQVFIIYLSFRAIPRERERAFVRSPEKTPINDHLFREKT